MSTFSEHEIAYMAAMTLGRLATQRPSGVLQNNPVAFTYNPERNAIDISGRAMGESAKFRNVAANGRVSFVIDDIASTSPWVVRCLEIRGTAEAIADPSDSAARNPGPIIRVHPQKIISWGMEDAPIG